MAGPRVAERDRGEGGGSVLDDITTEEATQAIRVQAQEDDKPCLRAAAGARRFLE